MRNVIIYFIDVLAVVGSILFGMFGAAGLCASIWGSSILDTALGDPPLRSHPAFVLFMTIAIPGMLLGAWGAITGIIVPLHMYLRVPFARSDAQGLRLLRSYAERFVAFVDDSI